MPTAYENYLKKYGINQSQSTTGAVNNAQQNTSKVNQQSTVSTGNAYENYLKKNGITPTQPRQQQVIAPPVVNIPAQQPKQSIMQTPVMTKVGNAVDYLFNPEKEGSLANKFWQSGVGSFLGKTQEAVEDYKPIKIVNVSESIENPYAKFAVSVPEGLTNSLFNTVTLRSPLTTGTTIGKDVNSGEITNPQVLASNIASVAEEILNAYIAGAIVKGVVKSAVSNISKAMGKPTVEALASATAQTAGWKIIVSGGIRGAQFGSAYGFLGGVKEGRDTKDLKQYAKDITVSTVASGVFGFAFGSTMSAVNLGASKLANKLFVSKVGTFTFKENPDVVEKNVYAKGMQNTPLGKQALEAVAYARSKGMDVTYQEYSLKQSKGGKVIGEDNVAKFFGVKNPSFSALPLKEGKISAKSYNGKVYRFGVAEKNAQHLVSDVKPVDPNITKAITAKGTDSRPAHQQQIEKFLNEGKPAEAWKIVNSMKSNDPYKASMESLLKNISPRPEAVNLTVYRGEGGKVQEALKQSGAGAMFGDGKYYATDAKYASNYGKVGTAEKLTFQPKEVLTLDTDAKLDAYVKKAMQAYPDITDSKAISKLATKEGYKAIVGFDTVNVLQAPKSINKGVKPTPSVVETKAVVETPKITQRKMVKVEGLPASVTGSSVVIRPDGTASYNLEVSETERGKGVGAKAVETIEEAILEQGVTKVILPVKSESVGFFAKQGYEAISEAKNGLVTMEKDLSVKPEVKVEAPKAEVKETTEALSDLAIKKNSPQELAYDLVRKLNKSELGDIKLSQAQKDELQQWDNKNGNIISSRGITAVKETPQWIADVWNKTQQPKAEIKPQVKETVLAVTETKPTVKTGELEKFDTYLQDKIGKDVKTATKKEILDNLGENEIESIPYTPEVAKKFGKSGAYNLRELESRPTLIYGGVNKHVFTDGFILISDKTVADKVNQTNIEKYKKEFTAMGVKAGMSYKEAVASAEKQINGQVESDLGYPPYEAIIPKKADVISRDLKPVDLIPQGLILSDGKNAVMVNADKYQYIKNLFPNASVGFVGETSPVVFADTDGEVQALIMPMRSNKLDKYKEPLKPESVVKEGYTASDPKAMVLSEKEIITSPYALKFKKDGYIKFIGTEVNSQSVAFMFRKLKENTVEQFYALGVKDNKPVYVELLTMGTINQTVVSPFDILPTLLEQDVDGLYMIHNHPSGDPMPSPDDFGVTEKIKRTLEGVDKKLYGHIVINTTKYGRIIDDTLFPANSGKMDGEVVDLPKEMIGSEKEVPVFKKYLEWNNESGNKPSLSRMDDVIGLMKGLVKDQKNVISAIFMDTRKKVIAIESLPVGITPQELIKKTVMNRAVNIILVNSQINNWKSYEELKKLQVTLGRFYSVNLVDALRVRDDGSYESLLDEFANDVYSYPPISGARDSIKEASKPTLSKKKSIVKPKEKVYEDLAFKPSSLKDAYSDVAKKESTKLIKRSEIAKEISKKLNVPIRMGKFRHRGALGLFKGGPKVVRYKAGGLPTIFHEVAHFIDSNLGFSKSLDAVERKALMFEYGYTYEGQAEKQRSEGFAEFVRFMMTGREAEAKSLAPKFYEEYKTRLETLPEIKNVLETATRDYKRWNEQPSSAKVLSQMNIGKTPKDPITERIGHELHTAYSAWVDDLHPLSEFSKVGKKTIGKIQAEKDPYVLARLMRGWVGKADLFLNTGTFDPSNYYNNDPKNPKMIFTGKSYKDILAPIVKANALDEFRIYIASERVINDLAPRKIKSGITLADAKEAIKEVEAKYPKIDFKAISAERREYKDSLLEYMKQKGVIGEEGLKNIKELNKFHVPFYRVVEGLEAGGYMGKRKIAGNLGSPLKRIKGNDFLEIIDPLESDVKDTYAFINASERNAVGVAMANLSKMSPELGRLFELVDRPMTATQISGEEIVQGLMKKVGEQMPIPEELQEMFSDIAITVFRPTQDRGNNMLNVNMGDKQLVFQVDADLFKAIQGMNQEDMTFYMRLLNQPAKLLRAGATLSPDFSVRNPIRDTFSATIFSDYGFRPGIDLVKGMFTVFTGKGQNKDIYNIWKASGGQSSMFASMDRGELQKNLKELIASRGEKALNIVKNPIDWLRMLSELGEMGTRLGEEQRALNAGASPTESALASREVTLDFAKMGYTARSVNMIKAFFSSQINGTDKMIRSFKKNPLRTLLKSILLLTVPSILLYLANRKDPRWKEIPMWQKNLFWVILTEPTDINILGNKYSSDGIWRIPKPFELGMLFASVPERVLEFIDTQDPKVLDDIKTSVLTGFLPDLSLLPTGAIPVVENWTNYSFFLDRPIVGRGQENMPPSQQFGNYTSEVAKIIGEALNYSPAKIDNLVQGYSGGLGNYATQTIDAVLKGTKVVNPPPAPEKSWEDMPVLKAFMIRKPIGTGSESVNRVYNMYGKLNQDLTYVKKLAKEGEVEKAQAYVKKNPDVINATLINATVSSFSDINKTIDEVRKSRDITPRQKKEMIEKLQTAQTEIASKVLDQIRESSK